MCIKILNRSTEKSKLKNVIEAILGPMLTFSKGGLIERVNEIRSEMQDVFRQR